MREVTTKGADFGVQYDLRRTDECRYCSRWMRTDGILSNLKIGDPAGRQLRITLQYDDHVARELLENSIESLCVPKLWGLHGALALDGWLALCLCGAANICART
jgi:hypothetical protein